jgi:hypothetical protein
MFQILKQITTSSNISKALFVKQNYTIGDRDLADRGCSGVDLTV